MLYMLVYNKFTYLLYTILIIVFLSPVTSLTSQPIYSAIGANILQVGSMVVVVESSPATLGFRNYSVTYSQSISNPKLVLGLNKLSILITSTPSSYNNKYLLANPLTATSNGFTSKLIIFTTGTVIYNVILQYMVYNNLDPLIQSLQITSLYSSISTSSFYWGQNYHEETLTMDRTFITPTNIRYYSNNPTCAVLTLGHKIQTTDVFKFVNANCTMQYGTNQAKLMIYASDNVIVDTYLASVFGIVIPQGRYIGYFQDVIDYSYVALQNSSNNIIATNTNISKEYFLLNINNYNKLSTSQFSIDIQSSLPTLMSGISIPIFYSIQGILVSNCLLQYTQQFNSSTYTLNIANADQSAQSIIPTPSVIGYNMGYLFSFGTVQCSNAYYYDAITSLCYQFWTGGDRQCTELEYMARMDYANANPSYDVDFVMSSNRNLGKAINTDSFTVMAYSSKGPGNWQLWILTSTTPSVPLTYTSADTGRVYTQSEINTSKISETSTNTSLDSLQIVYTGSNEYVIYGKKLYALSSGNSSILDQIADLTIAYNNTDKIIWSQMVKLTDISQQIKSSFTSLYNYTINNQTSPSNTQQSNQYQLLTTINSQLLMDIFLISNTQPVTAINLQSYTNSASQILNYIQTDTNIVNLTVSDILDNIQVQSKAISNRIVGAVLKLSTTINTNQYLVSETVEFIIDNYVFIYQIQLHFTVSGSSATVTSSTISLIQSKTLALSISGQQYPSDSNQIPSVYIRQLTINKPNYTTIPEYYNLSQYTYMEAFFSDTYYKNRQLYITYILSDGEITSFGALMPGLPDKYFVDLSVINLTVNYSYVYDCWGNSILDQNISSSYQYMNSPYSFYNAYYSSSNNNYNFYQLVIDKTINQAHSTILSQLSNEGNPSAINQFGTNPTAKGNNILLLTTTSGNHNSIDIVSTQENLFILANTNLLYIYEKQQLQTLSSSNSNNVGNRTIFQGYKLVRMVDIYKYLIQKIPESGTGQGQTAISIQVDEINGILYIGTNKGRLYKIQCGWGYTTNKFDSVTSLNNREYIYKYRQLNLPPPPVPNITNTTNSTNSSNATTVTNTTNATNTTNNSSINNTIIQPTIQPQTQSVAQTEQLSQTSVIVISVVCSVVGVACLFAFYFLFLKPTKLVKINPQMVSRTKHTTKTSLNDITQLGEKTEYRAERITSGKTEATLLQFQAGSQGTISPDKILKLKKTKQSSLTNLQIEEFSSRDSPYGTGQRGLIKQKDRIFIIQDMEI